MVLVSERNGRATVFLGKPVSCYFSHPALGNLLHIFALSRADIQEPKFLTNVFQVIGSCMNNGSRIPIRTNILIPKSRPNYHQTK